MKWHSLATLAFVGGVMGYAAVDLPAWGDGQAPAAVHVSPRYIEQAEAEAHTPNFVTAVIGDYRSYDTLFEVSVIFTAGLACAVVLARGERRGPPVR